mmetsp:Transcript_41206/g.132692  ORF Transcript_41206/g.132692 Transcript_41206/m.132692 type:complete len:672 (-) Transcript_41206:20-2035(-)
MVAEGPRDPKGAIHAVAAVAQFYKAPGGLDAFDFGRISRKMWVSHQDFAVLGHLGGRPDALHDAPVAGQRNARVAEVADDGMPAVGAEKHGGGCGAGVAETAGVAAWDLILLELHEELVQALERRLQSLCDHPQVLRARNLHVRGVVVGLGDFQKPPQLVRQEARRVLGAVGAAVAVEDAEQPPGSGRGICAEDHSGVAVVLLHGHAPSLRPDHVERRLEARPLREHRLLPLQARLPHTLGDGGRGDHGADAQKGRGDDGPRLRGQALGKISEREELREQVGQRATRPSWLQQGRQDAGHCRRLNASRDPFFNKSPQLPARCIAAVEDSYEDLAQGVHIVVKRVRHSLLTQRVRVHKVEVAQGCPAHLRRRPPRRVAVHQRDAEVPDEGGAPGAQQKVRGLQIPMLYRLAVDVQEPISELYHDAQRFVHQHGLRIVHPVEACAVLSRDPGLQVPSQGQAIHQDHLGGFSGYRRRQEICLHLHDVGGALAQGLGGVDLVLRRGDCQPIGGGDPLDGRHLPSLRVHAASHDPKGALAQHRAILLPQCRVVRRGGREDSPLFRHFAHGRGPCRCYHGRPGRDLRRPARRLCRRQGADASEPRRLLRRRLCRVHARPRRRRRWRADEPGRRQGRAHVEDQRQQHNHNRDAPAEPVRRQPPGRFGRHGAGGGGDPK